MANEIYIYDDIGPEWAGMVSAKSIITQLESFQGQAVTLRINSPGGSVWEAMAIYNAIQRHSGEVTVAIDGVALSAASHLAMGAKEIVIAENAMMMIHDPWTVAIGNAAEMRRQADVLDKHSGGIAETYAKRAGKDVSEIVEAMAKETWYTAQEAVDFGLADSIGQALNVKASIKDGRYKNTPAKMIANTTQRERAVAMQIREMQIALAKKRLTHRA